MEKLKAMRICSICMTGVFFALAVVNFYFGRPIISAVFGLIEIAVQWILGTFFTLAILASIYATIFPEAVNDKILEEGKKSSDVQAEHADAEAGEETPGLQDEHADAEADEETYDVLDEYADVEADEETHDVLDEYADAEAGEADAEASHESPGDATSDDNWI